MAVHAVMRLDLHRPQIRELLTGPAGPAVRFIRSSLRKVRTRAVLRCPVRTGNLRNSIREELVVHGDHIDGTVGTDVAYARWVHDGTGPYTIRPRRPGGVLRFEAGGEVVFATHVRHPGIRAQPFLRQALDEVAEPLGFRIRRL
jgi:hypothetical protein